jgi:hypothetical protein
VASPMALLNRHPHGVRWNAGQCSAQGNRYIWCAAISTWSNACTNSPLPPLCGPAPPHKTRNAQVESDSRTHEITWSCTKDCAVITAARDDPTRGDSPKAPQVLTEADESCPPEAKVRLLFQEPASLVVNIIISSYPPSFPVRSAFRTHTGPCKKYPYKTGIPPMASSVNALRSSWTSTSSPRRAGPSSRRSSSSHLSATACEGQSGSVRVNSDPLRMAGAA